MHGRSSVIVFLSPVPCCWISSCSVFCSFRLRSLLAPLFASPSSSSFGASCYSARIASNKLLEQTLASRPSPAEKKPQSRVLWRHPPFLIYELDKATRLAFDKTREWKPSSRLSQGKVLGFRQLIVVGVLVESDKGHRFEGTGLNVRRFLEDDDLVVSRF